MISNTQNRDINRVREKYNHLRVDALSKGDKSRYRDYSLIMSGMSIVLQIISKRNGMLEVSES